VTLEIMAARTADAEPLGAICYDAFRVMQERHGLPPDWPSPAAAQQALGLLIADPAVEVVMAVRDGQIVGSNALSHHDAWGGIGPLTVAPRWQGQGIGRALMEAVMAQARARGIERLRLQQDAANMASLALYTMLGFRVQEMTVVLEARPWAHDGAGIRAATPADLEAIARLGQRHLGFGRHRAVAAALAQGFVVLVQEDELGLRGYFIAGRRGHGVAETEASMLALINAAAKRLAPGPARCFCPLSEAGLFRALLVAGCRAGKVMTLMARGSYKAPRSVCLPSVLG
jgi:predicted N-acetyltransferase YhbS